MKFQIDSVGYQQDMDGNFHPSISLLNENVAAELYDHPSEGWQVIYLGEGILPRYVDYRDDVAQHVFESHYGELNFAPCAAIAADLREMGRDKAYVKWVGQTIELQEDK